MRIAPARTVCSLSLGRALSGRCRVVPWGSFCNRPLPSSLFGCSTNPLGTSCTCSRQRRRSPRNRCKAPPGTPCPRRSRSFAQLRLSGRMCLSGKCLSNLLIPNFVPGSRRPKISRRRNPCKRSQTPPRELSSTCPQRNPRTPWQNLLLPWRRRTRIFQRRNSGRNLSVGREEGAEMCS